MDHLPAHKLACFLFLALLAFLFMPVSISEPANENAKPAAQAEQPLEKRVQHIKKEVSRLNRDLFILEEELLFPASTQVVIFVSLNDGYLFKLDSVELKINDKLIASHLYTDREANSLKKGGVQRLYIGNLPAGEHELVAFFTGLGPNEIEYRRGTTLVFEKTLTTKYIELQISDNSTKQQPEFIVKQW